SFGFAWHALKSNLMRTILSLLGVTIGIFAIIAVFTVVDSLEKSFRESMNFLGDKVIYVQKWPWEFGGEYAWWKYMNRPVPSLAEYKLLEKRLENHQGMAIFWTKGGNTLKSGNNNIADVTLQGVSFGFDQVSDVRLADGRYFVQSDIDAAKPVAIIGASVAEGLFPGREALGKEIKLKGFRFRVIGVMEKQGESFLGTPSSDNNAIIPYGMFNKMFASLSSRGIEPILAIKGLKSDEGSLELESEIRGAMRSIRGLRPRDDDNFALNRPEMIAGVITQLFSVLNIAGTIIGGFSILVGGFGIANIMFVSVKERTNLIGIQKSLGAKNSFILFQFLFESIFLSLIGGGVGIF
ncbi:MAG: ABC transporter permease, partial [Sphingobacteriales bacterium]